jgi:hypothetical protein
MNIPIVSNGWIHEIKNVPLKKPVKMWIDTSKIPDSGTFNIFYAWEPKPISEFFKCYFLDWLKENGKYFDLILSHDDEIIKTFPHARYIHWTKSFINHHEVDLFSINDKKFKVTFICGGKLWTPDQFKRKELWMRQNEIKIPKELFYSVQYRGQLPVTKENKALPRDSKLPAFNDSMFHIAMENSRIRGYFSEKIVDCFITYTIPIYFGCPNIGDFFHKEGIIIANSVDEIIEIVNNLTEEDYYSRKEWMEKNREIAKNYPNNQQQGLLQHLKPILKEFELI